MTEMNGQQIVDSLMNSFNYTLLKTLEERKEGDSELSDSDLFLLEAAVLYMISDVQEAGGLTLRYAITALELVKAKQAGNTDDVKTLRARLQGLQLEMESIKMKHEMMKKSIIKPN